MPEWSQNTPGEPAAWVLRWLLALQGDVSSFPAVIKAFISPSSQGKGVLLSQNIREWSRTFVCTQKTRRRRVMRNLESCRGSGSEVWTRKVGFSLRSPEKWDWIQLPERFRAASQLFLWAFFLKKQWGICPASVSGSLSLAFRVGMYQHPNYSALGLLQAQPFKG